jgi:hypothetical protein
MKKLIMMLGLIVAFTFSNSINAKAANELEKIGNAQLVEMENFSNSESHKVDWTKIGKLLKRLGKGLRDTGDWLENIGEILDPIINSGNSGMSIPSVIDLECNLREYGIILKNGLITCTEDVVVFQSTAEETISIKKGVYKINEEGECNLTYIYNN